MYKNTHTKQKTVQRKIKTNKKPPSQKHFRVLFESVTGWKDSIPIFLFEEKKTEIWLSSMTHTVLQGATPVRWRSDKHVTKLTGLCEPVYGSITPLLRAGRGRRGEGRGRVEKNGAGGIGGRGNEENSARFAPKGGGETRVGRHKFTMRIIFKGTRNILTRLSHLNFLFGFYF